MANTPSVFVLDTFAVLAHFQAEAGGDKVRELFLDAENGDITLAMSLINVGEMVYIVSREQGRQSAQSMLDDLRALPIKLYDASESRIFAAAWLKSQYPISYADAFAATLEQELDAQLVTNDPEFASLTREISVFWLEK